MKVTSIMAALALCALVQGCTKEPVEVQASTNAEIPVSLLFENDGCKVYRFYDAGEYIYYTKCKWSSQTSWEEMEGKVSEPRQVTTEYVD
jgi:hypothetical protein